MFLQVKFLWCDIDTEGGNTSDANNGMFVDSCRHETRQFTPDLHFTRTSLALRRATTDVCSPSMRLVSDKM